MSLIIIKVRLIREISELKSGVPDDMESFGKLNHISCPMPISHKCIFMELKNLT